MMPILPHLSNECFEIVKTNSDEVKWPSYDERQITEETKVIVIQINGKKRGLINTKLNLEENGIFNLVKRDQNMNKYLLDKEVKKKIYIKNKLMNIII